jgi:DNA-3-methyladenine glycosylase I
VFSVRQNAVVWLGLESSGMDVPAWFWSFVGGRPIVNQWSGTGALPAKSPESEAMSRALKKAGFGFVGPTTVYAFMQAVGMVNDHAVDCICRH